MKAKRPSKGPPTWGRVPLLLGLLSGCSAAVPAMSSLDALAESAGAQSVAVASYGEAAPQRLASAASMPEPAPPGAPPLAETRQQTATDAAQAGPILVYTASFVLSVYEVDKAQRLLKEAAQQLGGFVSVQTDAQITIRVPAERFEAALTAVETTGKVQTRSVEALDVGAEYRDLSIRLRTAESVRGRLEAMLARAEKVDEALRVEQELERIVREIELLKGQLRSLADRVAYSTLAIAFRPEARPDLDDSEVFRLPYAWLDELGLHHLLELAP
jgi:hypothetical protein